jgi:hypothetical protein
MPDAHDRSNAVNIPAIILDILAGSTGSLRADPQPVGVVLGDRSVGVQQRRVLDALGADRHGEPAAAEAGTLQRDEGLLKLARPVRIATHRGSDACRNDLIDVVRAQLSGASRRAAALTDHPDVSPDPETVRRDGEVRKCASGKRSRGDTIRTDSGAR